MKTKLTEEQFRLLRANVNEEKATEYSQCHCGTIFVAVLVDQALNDLIFLFLVHSQINPFDIVRLLYRGLLYHLFGTFSFVVY